MDGLYVILLFSSTINNANIEKYRTSGFHIVHIYPDFLSIMIKIHGSTAKKKTL